MCLNVTKDARIKTVKRERTVYKIMNLKKQKNIAYSPFRHHKIKFGESYKIDGDLKINRYWWDSDGDVEEGFHSFRNYEDAVSEIKRAKQTYVYYGVRILKLCIVECKIPVGAQIVKGTFGTGLFGYVESYTSNEIKYVKPIVEYNI